MSDAPRPGWVVSCEHAGRRVPRRYRHLFADDPGVLDTHRGWDPGAAALARTVAGTLDRAPLLHDVTRLLADANRSPDHPRCLSEFSRRLPPAEREALLERVHAPHRGRVRDAVAAEIDGAGTCIHLSVHTFTPRLQGAERAAEVGLLYDPGRRWERAVCARWKTILADESPGWRIRRNYPYRGVSDGLTTTLRRSFPPGIYAGIELEVNQALLRTTPSARTAGAALRRSVDRLRGALQEAWPESAR